MPPQLFYTLTDFFHRYRVLILLFLFSFLAFSLYLDAVNSIPMPDDLRNRVVGSRMLMDGESPYFYVWHIGEPIKYYDRPNASDAVASAVTGTPFFHRIFGIFSYLPQGKINRLWMAGCFINLLACLIFTILLFKKPIGNKLIVAFGFTVLFTFTAGWRCHVNVGQYYISIPALALACCYFLQRKERWAILLFGLLSVVAFLFRPLTAVLFIPYLLYASRYFKWFISAALFFCAYAVFAFFQPVERKNWNDYFESVQKHIAMHQGLVKYVTIDSAQRPVLSKFEDVVVGSNTNKWKKGHENDVELSNINTVYVGYFGKPVPLQAATLISLLIAALLMTLLVLLKRKKQSVSVEDLMIIGFLIYNTMEFFSPIPRYNYYFVQLALPLYLLISKYENIKIIPVTLILAGMILNITHMQSLEHIKGQFMILLAIFLTVYRPLWINENTNRSLKISDSVYWL